MFFFLVLYAIILNAFTKCWVFCATILNVFTQCWVLCATILCAFQTILGMFDFKTWLMFCATIQSAFNICAFKVLMCSNSECFHKVLNVLCNNSLCFSNLCFIWNPLLDRNKWVWGFKLFIVKRHKLNKLVA
jgi:hypothetical protein